MSDMNIGSKFISKRETNILKGVALVLMFIHHFFTFPGWRLDTIQYAFVDKLAPFIQQPTKICVPIFAFLTGFFYFYAKKKSILYSIKKITDLWIIYLSFFIIMLVPAILLGLYEINIINIGAEMIGFDRGIMSFCWYVVFYAIAMMILPLLVRLEKNNSILAIIFVVIVPYAISVPLSLIPIDNPLFSLIRVCIKYTKWLPTVASGYIFAKYSLFDNLYEKLSNLKNIVKIFIYIGFILISFIARYDIIEFDFIYAPTFIFGILGLVKMIKFDKMFAPIAVIGKYSLPMWFAHCAFFNVLSVYLQKILYLPKDPILVLLWGLLMCLAISAVLMIPLNAIIKLKNKILKW